MVGFDVKKNIEKNVIQAIKEFEEREDIVTKFGDPIIGYVDATHLLFDMFFTRQLSDHPKHIYRPGNTLIVHFVPYADDITESNMGNSEPSVKWSRAFTESMWLSMKLNRVIRETLNVVGRLSSCANTPIDWNEELHHENWSHKMAAYAAGMGEFGPAGSFCTKAGFGGRLSTVITDGKYADTPMSLSDQQLKEAFRTIITQCCYEGADNISCSDEMINSCPGKAISKNGIDRQKCQDHCKTIDEHIPSPDVCGKCFFFK